MIVGTDITSEAEILVKYYHSLIKRGRLGGWLEQWKLSPTIRTWILLEFFFLPSDSLLFCINLSVAGLAELQNNCHNIKQSGPKSLNVLKMFIAILNLFDWPGLNQAKTYSSWKKYNLDDFKMVNKLTFNNIILRLSL